MSAPNFLMPPTSEGSQANWCLSCAVLSLVLIIVCSFFVSSSFLHGILVIGIPVIVLLMAVGCLLSKKPRVEANPVDEEIFLQRAAISRVPPTVCPLNDCPPSYRLTWRRSFLKRLKSTSMFSSERSPENTPPVTPDAKAQSIAEPAEVPAVSITIEVIPTLQDSQDSQDSTTNETPTPVGRDGLPTYDEAIEIMASRENLS